MRSDWFLVLITFLTQLVLQLQSADKDEQEMRAVAEKPSDAIVKFDTYRNLQSSGPPCDSMALVT